MRNKLIIAIFAMLFSLSFVFAITEFERSVDPRSNDAGISGANWNAQTFTVGNTSDNIQQNISLVALQVRKASASGTPEITHISIRAVNDSGGPTGEDLVAGSINASTFGTSVTEWHNITMNSSFNLLPSTQYAIIIRSPQSGGGGDRTFLQINESGPTYAAGNHFTSGNSGGKWVSASGTDAIFEIWGDRFLFTEEQSGHNGTGFETDSNLYLLNISTPSSVTSVSSVLIYNGTNFIATTSCNASNFCQISRILDIPVQTPQSANISFVWNVSFVDDGSTFHREIGPKYQNVSKIHLSICRELGGTVTYLNFTFKNETTNQPSVNAFLPSSTWNYYLGGGSSQRTLTHANATERKSFEFCFTPTHKTVNINVSLSYDNSESEQRIFNPNIFTVSRGSFNQTLFLLPTSDGIFVTFQVLNVAEQPIQRALVKLTRAGFGTISEVKTGASGTVNVFLNPNAAYTLTVTANGFDTFSTTQAFPTSEFTITLGGENKVGTDHTKGITTNVLPKASVLLNNTVYAFNFTIGSSFWSLDTFGFTLSNSSGTQLASVSSTSSTGGIVNTTINTGNQTFILMNYFWEINNTHTNLTTSWAVRSGSDGSVKGFFDRVQDYVDDGIFGITDFALTIILFTAMLIFVGVLSFKFGLTSPVQIMLAATFFVILIDFGLGLLPNPISAVPFFPSIIMILLSTIVYFGRNT